MKPLLKIISATAGLFVLMVVVMFIFRICPPQGPWPMPPWCEGSAFSWVMPGSAETGKSESQGSLAGDGRQSSGEDSSSGSKTSSGDNSPSGTSTEEKNSTFPSVTKPAGPSSSKTAMVKVEIMTPYSTQDVFIEAGGQTQKLTRVNEIYAQGLVELGYGQEYTVTMGSQQKQGVFSGGYTDFLKEGKRTGEYPWSNLKFPQELLGVEDFLFDHLPIQGAGRSMMNGFYTGAGGNAQVMSSGNFFTTARRDLLEMARAGAGWVNIVPMWFFFPHDEHSYGASSELRPIYRDEFYKLQRTGYNYPTYNDEELKGFIRAAHAAGLKVYLVPHITPANWGPNTMSGKGSLIVDDIDVFFENYTKMIIHYAKIAQDTGVELLGLGCENDSLTIMEQNVYPGVDLNQKWYDLIKEARTHYKGKLTYSAAAADLNYSAPNQVEFWDALDYIGFEWYLPITNRKEASIGELVKAAQDAIEKLAKPLHQKYGKPLLLAEVGFEGKPYAWTRSYEGSSQEQAFDRLAAAICYEYLFQAIQDYSFIEGMFIWSWQPAHGTNEKFPKDMWWAITNSGNEVQYSIVQPQLTKWIQYHGRK